MATALVTGPTAGIGLAFARKLAGRGHDLVLVSRDERRLNEVAAELSGAYGINAEVLAADLAVDTEAVQDRLGDSRRPVDLLVNNAGFGLRKPLLANDLADEERVVDVMIRAVLRLTYAAVPGMVERGHGAVVNVGSTAAWLPTGSYSAAKAWVQSFSEALAARVRGSGVRVMVLAPGFTRTEFHDRAKIDMTSLPSWMWLDADALVDAALRDLDRGRTVSVPGAVYKLAAVALPRLPRVVVEAVGRRHPARRRRP